MWFFTAPDGKQLSTGVSDPHDEAGACAARERLLAEFAAAVAARMSAAPVPPPSPLIRDSVAAFRSSRRVSAKTQSHYADALTPFVAAFGALTVAALVPDEVERWAASRGWSRSTQNTYLGAVQTWLRWAGRAVRIRRPPKESRGAEVALSDEQFTRVLEVVSKPARGGNGDLPALLRCLRLTGARPQELAPLTVAAVDWENGCVRLTHHKTAHRGHRRTIYFPADALAILEAQRARYGTGALFRTRYGNPYSNPQLVRALLGVSKVVGFRVCAYGMRHTFATSALAAGVPDAVVAELLGHRGTGMVAAHYGHLSQRSQVLRAAVERAGLTPPPEGA